MDQVIDELKSDLIALIRIKEWKTLKYELEKLEAVSVAELFKDISERDKIIIFRLLDKQQTKEVFKLLSHSKQQEIINGLAVNRSEEHTSELQSRPHLVCRLLLEKKNKSYRLRRTM